MVSVNNMPGQGHTRRPQMRNEPVGSGIVVVLAAAHNNKLPFMASAASLRSPSNGD